MKCDELKALVFSISDLAYVDEPTPQPNFQNPHDHAVYKATEVDEAIAQLKEKLHDVDNKWNEQCKEIAELKAENEQLKAKLENVQATAYADSVDAGMRERRLKRALWIARAERADDRARIFYFSDLESVLDIDGFSYDSKKKKGCKKLTARLWRIIWLNVERKCRDKAEEWR